MKKVIAFLLVVIMITGVLGLNATAFAKSVSVPKPTSVKAAQASASAINVTWRGSSKISGCQVYRKINSGSYTKVATVGKSVRKYTDKVTAGNTYTYRVRFYLTKSSKKHYSSFVTSNSIKINKPVVSKPKPVNPNAVYTAVANGIKWTYKLSGNNAILGKDRKSVV